MGTFSPKTCVFLVFIAGGIAAFTDGCEKASPAVTKIHPEEARPGATVTIAGKGLGDKSSDPVVKVGETEARVKSRGADSLLVIELPKGLAPGSYELVVTNPGAKSSSKPVKLRIANEVITVPSGTSLKVRTVEGISSDGNHAGDTFHLTLDQPLVIHGRTVAGAGSEVLGRVTNAKESGRVAGRAEIGFTLVQLKPTNGSRTYPLVTDNVYTRAQGTKKRDAAMIGGGAGVGALIGAIAGGKKGALIGAGVGGAAGTGAALATRGDEVGISPGARFSFRLNQPVEIEMTGDQPVASAR